MVNLTRYAWRHHSLRYGGAVGKLVEDPQGEFVKFDDMVAQNSTSTNKQMVAALWSALESKDVPDIGYSFPDSEWMPVNIDRLNAAWEKVMR